MAKKYRFYAKDQSCLRAGHVNYVARKDEDIYAKSGDWSCCYDGTLKQIEKEVRADIGRLKMAKPFRPSDLYKLTIAENVLDLLESRK